MYSSILSTSEQYKVRIVVRNGKFVEYDVPTMKMENYNSNAIFEKNLYFFYSRRCDILILKLLTAKSVILK